MHIHVQNYDIITSEFYFMKRVSWTMCKRFAAEANTWNRRTRICNMPQQKGLSYPTKYPICCNLNRTFDCSSPFTALTLLVSMPHTISTLKAILSNWKMLFYKQFRTLYTKYTLVGQVISWFVGINNVFTNKPVRCDLRPISRTSFKREVTVYFYRNF